MDMNYLDGIINDYSENYDMIFLHDSKLSQDKVIIEDPIKKCRFCDKSEPSISFKNIAHAIPELIGNKIIFLRNECDDCNMKFSVLLEDHLGKYLGLWRTMMQIKGKNGIPSYKAPDGISRIDMASTGIEISSFEEDPVVDVNEVEKTVTVKGYRQPYVPIAVFKCFVKMALSVIPYNLLGNFCDTKKWLLEDNHEVSCYDIQPIFTITSFVPGVKPFGELLIIVLCRKNDTLEVPFMQMIISFGNMGFQIIVPCSSKDFYLSNKPLNITPFPHPTWSSNKLQGNLGIGYTDLSGKQLIKNEPISVIMGYEHSEKTQN